MEENTVIETTVYEEVVPLEAVEITEVAQPTVPACDSCGASTELFDVPHHQPGNPKIWKYCSRCKMTHELEVAVTEKLKEIQAMNPAAVNDPATVSQIRNQLSQELLQRN